jgi:putative transposase
VSTADPQRALRLQPRELAATRVAHVYRRLHVPLSHEGWQVNHKRVYRLYRIEGLAMRKKTPRRRVACVKREDIRPSVLTRKERRSMDFVSDQLFDDRRLRVLVIIENFTRECLALDANARILVIDVVRTLERITHEHGFPKRIKVNNGPKFISKDLDRWAYWNYVELDFSRPGKPSYNALAEAFKSRYRQESLNQHWFLTMENAKMKLSKWQNEYNTAGPHNALGYRTPIESRMRSSNAKTVAE